MTAFWSDSIDPLTEPARVLIKRGQWIDDTRDNRIIKYKIYYPDSQPVKPLPLIIWSHGLGGTEDGAGFIARFLASHGYIHLHIGHEGTNDSLWRGRPGHPWDNIRKAHIPWETVLNRYRDVPFALNQLSALDLLIDSSNLGMSGHSFGALTTQIMAGQLTGNPEPISLFESRFKASIAYSPVPNKRLLLPPKQVYGGMNLPLMHMTGTEDYSPLEGDIQSLRDEIFDHAGGSEKMQYSVILNGADHMVFNGSRGQLPDYEGIDTHKEQIKILALAWWEYYLKNNAKAGHWLAHACQDYLGTSSMVKVKNNAF
jgi:dienelactone hydrolase